MMHGFLNIDKAAGMTSHDVVAYVRRLSSQRRIGHAGTLDPAATGVLILGLGAATRLISYVQDDTLKRYTAIVSLGIQTSTDDAEGDIIQTAPVPALSQNRLEQLLASFQGTILQVPPMYAALHHQGRRLYEIARSGEVIERAARPVLIERLEIVAWQTPYLTLDIVCGKGTYIRALARDLGQTLGCGAHLSSLRRTAVGAFHIDQALTLDQLSANIEHALLSPELAVSSWLRLDASQEEIRRLRTGMPIQAQSGTHTNKARVHDAHGTLVALVEHKDESWQPYRVFDW